MALSFIQRPEDIAEAKKITRGRAAVMAKIEKPQAVTRLDDILDFADALMVARGDLGVEMPLEKVPGIQKQMTRACRRAGKPVVVATQMLESMITSPVPTRAEVSDVATAIFEGADAVMLSAESAAGQYPVEAVATMNRIAEEVENDPIYRRIIARAAHRAGSDRRRRDRGRGAPDRRDARSLRHRVLDLFRLDRPARRARAAEVADRRDLAERRRPGASWRWSGACIASSPRTRATRTTWWSALAGIAFREGFAKAGQRIIIVAGVPLGTPGATNMLRIAFVGPDSECRRVSLAKVMGATRHARLISSSTAATTRSAAAWCSRWPKPGSTSSSRFRHGGGEPAPRGAAAKPQCR